MNLFEYQAKQVFEKEGITVPNSQLAATAQEVGAAVDNIGLPCVVKSQVLMGGRGKAGLVKLAKTKEDAQKMAQEMFASEYGVSSILIEEAVPYEQELYVSVILDAAGAQGVVLACASGGIDIEEIAHTNPELIIKTAFNLNAGLMPYQCREIAYGMGLTDKTAKLVANIIMKLVRLFVNTGAEMAEINPLFVVGDERLVVAGDGKLILDDNTAFAKQNFAKATAVYTEEAERMAAEEGMPYLGFDGDIALMCAGAGLTTVVYDLVNYAGGSVSTYLEFGGPHYKKAHRAMEICLKHPTEVILIVAFGTIARVDIIAQEAVRAIEEFKPSQPVIFCLRGTNEERAREILQNAGQLTFTDTEEAVEKAVELAKEIKSR